MRSALPQQTSWVTVAIFALTGGVVGMLAGGVLQTGFGICVGLVLGSLAGPALIQIGYVAAGLALCYGGISFYSAASLRGFQTNQSQSLRQELPAGSTFGHVYSYLKEQNANHLNWSPVRHTASTMLTADYDTRFLLGRYRMHTKFVFDKHDKLSRCWIVAVD